MISAPGPARPWASPWFGACLCFAKSSAKWFCEIVEDPWWFLDVFWWVLISFPLFFAGFRDFAGLLGAAGPPVAVVAVAFVFPVSCGGFKGSQSVLEGNPPSNLPISL